ncbi:MAG: response regulator receiver protein [Oceanobacter sp.]|nr:MAG: response regulator receiver protein [Oceanobacter sp.]
MKHKVVVLGCMDVPSCEEQLGDQFEVLVAASYEQSLPLVESSAVKLIILMDDDEDGTDSLSLVRQFHEYPDTAEIPLVLLALKAQSLETRMAFFDAGCDDHIQGESPFELQMRLMRVIFNKIANDQLKQKLVQANEMAFIAMSDTSDLGVNVQFLLDINHCDNLDEAGMRLFQALKSYNINCSLQIRSRYGVKNMEANGMAKELESTLMTECKDKGRYVDFGRRSIMNYDRVSLLVRNMPVDDKNKYGAIKDNVFSLLQGLDARLNALDNVESLKLESQLVGRLTSRMRELMEEVDEGYHVTMTRIAGAVEDIADGIEREIQFLGMDEAQERAIQKIMEDGIRETNQVFNDGLKLDKGLAEFLGEVEQVFSSGHMKAKQLVALMEKMPASGKVH